MWSHFSSPRIFEHMNQKYESMSICCSSNDLVTILVLSSTNQIQWIRWIQWIQCIGHWDCLVLCGLFYALLCYWIINSRSTCIGHEFGEICFGRHSIDRINEQSMNLRAKSENRSGREKERGRPGGKEKERKRISHERKPRNQYTHAARLEKKQTPKVK